MQIITILALLVKSCLWLPFRSFLMSLGTTLWLTLALSWPTAAAGSTGSTRMLGLSVSDRVALGGQLSIDTEGGQLHLSNQEGIPLLSVGPTSPPRADCAGLFCRAATIEDREAWPITVDIGALWVNGSIEAGELDVTSSPLPQWTLVATDLFSSPPRGWSTNLTSTCGGPNKILGGYCRLAATPIDKRFERLPRHNFVRVLARFYFIDGWERAGAWMMLDETTAWTHQHTAGAQRQGRAVRSVCGREDAPDRIGVLVDVMQPHAAATLTVGFGTTGLDGADPCLVSYGVQAVEVYVR